MSRAAEMGARARALLADLPETASAGFVSARYGPGDEAYAWRPDGRLKWEAELTLVDDNARVTVETEGQPSYEAARAALAELVEMLWPAPTDEGRE